MPTKTFLLILGLAWHSLLLVAQETATPSPTEALTSALSRLLDIIEPTNTTTPSAFQTRFKVTRGEGLPRELRALHGTLAWQAPDRLALSANTRSETYSAGRDGQEVWAHVAGKGFGVRGRPGVPLFLSASNRLDATDLPPLRLGVPRAQLLLLPLLMKSEWVGRENVAGAACQVLQTEPLPPALKLLPLPPGRWVLALRESDHLPVRIGYSDNTRLDVLVELEGLNLTPSPSPETWKMPSQPGDHIEITAVSHLTRFLATAWSQLNNRIPSLPPSDGSRRLLATEGQGRLEMIDHTRVLFLKGTPEEMGRQHGILLRKQVQRLVDRVLYGVGVGSSFQKGRWFFGEIEAAQARLAPFMDPRYLREMDALAAAAGLSREEVRLANYFPELFHCSGFALAGDATQDGRLYHGRILDYLRGMGLEQNAVVMILQPDQGHAWLNVGYAGFIGSVTAMNEKKIAIGEMGGRGEGNWDGKPMAQLVREVMEKSSTLDEAVEIMRKGPRTCEYYYVISDGKSRRAVGIAATPDHFEVVQMGEAHPRLPHRVKDAVLLSAGDRYEKLVERVRAGYGRFDAASARALMERPVAMNSNIHSVLFEPETLDVWVANADSERVASHNRYVRYNLAELLKPPASPAQ